MSIITGYITYDLIGLLIAVATILLLYGKWAFCYWKDRNVPFIEPTFPWGNFKPLYKRVVPLGDEITEMYQKAKSKGWRHLGLYSMTAPVYLPIDLDIVRSILTKDFSHFVNRGVYHNEKDDPLSANMFAIGGQKWRNLRTKFTPTFTSGKMRQMFQTLTDCGIELEQYLLKEVSHHEPIDIKYVLGNFSTDIIGSCAFGLECNSFKDPKNPFRRIGIKIFTRSNLANFKKVFGLNFPGVARFFGVTITEKDITQFLTKVVSDTVSYREKNNVNRRDFLQLLIDIKNNKEDSKQPGDGNSLTMDEMVAQSFVFFAAGFETSSTTMSFALYELSRNPEMQEKARKEIIDVLKKYNGAVTYDSIKEMKYLGQVIDETLRKYPALPFITRQCVESYVIPDTNVKIEKGVMTFIPIKAIHSDPDYYENPDVFDPDRFSDENKNNRNQYAYIPFGEGPRMCIGMRFGIMQSKLGLVSVLKHYEVTVNKKTIEPLKFLINGTVPQIEGGIWLDLKKI